VDASKLNPEDIEFNPNYEWSSPGEKYKSGYIVRNTKSLRG